MNKTEIKLSVERTIKTADFEGLRVNSEITEIIEWENEKDRDKKIDRVVDHLKNDFVKSYNIITESIGVKRSLGTAVLRKADGNKHTANVVNDKNDDEIDMFDE